MPKRSDNPSSPGAQTVKVGRIEGTAKVSERPTHVERTAPTNEPADDPLVGSLCGKYRLVQLIGRGGMGAVYEGVHQQIQKRAAVKVLSLEWSKDPLFARRFFDEARAVHIVRHPGLVETLEFDQRPDGMLYLVMEYVEGESLAARLARDRRIAESATLPLILQLSRALAAAHGRGVVHRDLKPSNIMLTPDPVRPDELRVKVVDFGIAKLMSAQAVGDAEAETIRFVRTDQDAIMGTQGYMAPEQYDASTEVDGKADVFALGCIFYEMLTGETAGRTAAAIVSKTSELMQRLTHVASASTVALVRSMLAAEPASRPTMQTVMDTLKHRLRPGWWGHRGLLQAAIAAFVVVSLCGTWLAYRRSISALRRRAIAIVRDQGMYAPTGDMRQHALRLMGQSRTAELLPFAIPLLNDPDPRIREAAIRALEPLASANELDTLQALARQRPVTAVQLFAARATERIRPGAADDLIGDALTQSPASLRVQGDLILFRPDDRTRTARLKAWFTQYASGASIPLLTDVLSRLVAARDLDALRKLNELLATLPESPDRIRLASLAVEYSTGSEQRAYEILTELAGRNGDLQVQAARALVELGRTSVCPQLSEVARSSAHSINRRLVAVGGLAICARDEDVRVLRDLMDDAQPIAALRLEAAGAFLSLLANQPMREGLAVNRWLLQAQQSASEQQRELAMLALGLSEDSDAVEGLLAGLSDRSTRVRLQAIRALARKPTRSAALALQQALQDGDKTVQEASIAALRDVLTGLSSSGDRGVRSLLMPTVERLAQDTGNSLQIPAQGLLLRLGNTKPRGELAAVAVGSESRLRLRAIPWIDDTSVLRSGLVNQDVEVRIASALRLSELGSQEGIPVLREASRTGELLGLRSYVALLRMAVPTPPPPDIDSLLTTAAPDIRSQAIELLANLSPGAAAAKLRLVLHDHSPSLRYQAVDVALRLLRKRPEQPLIEALQASLQQETESVIRVQVQEALQQALARRDLRLQPQERPDAPASKALVAPIRASTSPALTTAPQVSATAPSSSGHTGPEPGTPVELARGTLVLSGPRSLRIRINDGVPLTLPVAPQVVGPGIYRISYIGGSKIVTVSPGQRVAIELPANAVLNQLYEELPTTSRLQVVDEASFNADRLAMFERRVEQAPGDPELKHNLLMQVAMQYDMYGYAKRACAIYAKLANTEVAASIDQDGRLTRARKKCTAQK